MRCAVTCWAQKDVLWSRKSINTKPGGLDTVSVPAHRLPFVRFLHALSKTGRTYTAPKAWLCGELWRNWSHLLLAHDFLVRDKDLRRSMAKNRGQQRNMKQKGTLWAWAKHVSSSSKDCTLGPNYTCQTQKIPISFSDNIIIVCRARINVPPPKLTFSLDIWVWNQRPFRRAKWWNYVTQSKCVGPNHRLYRSSVLTWSYE